MSWFDEGTKRQTWRRTLLTALGLLAVGAVYGRFKPLPPGVSVASRAYLMPAGKVRILADLTGQRQGKQVVEQEIFREITGLIAGAKRFVVVNFFLFHEFPSSGRAGIPDRTNEFTSALLAKRRSDPGVPIIFLVDPIATVYGGGVNPQLEQLRQAGVTVVETALTKLRDSNPVYGALWRATARWLGNRPGAGRLPHPFNPGQKIGWRSWLALLNFQANHRHVVMADRRGNVVSIVTSADANSADAGNSNLAVEFVNGPWRELLASTQAVAAFSGQSAAVDVSGLAATLTSATSTVTLQLVTEGKIAAVLGEQLQAIQPGDAIDVLARVWADRRMLQAVQEAADRGAAVRVILDPNQTEGHWMVDGLPNGPVASELMLKGGKNVFVRWYHPHGERLGATLVLIRRQDGSASLVTGSAYLTKRSLRDLNLEADVHIAGSQTAPPLARAARVFDQLWANSGGGHFTTEYADFRDDSLWRGVRVRLMERLGWNNY